jgi:PleD family two-component response regulator
MERFINILIVDENQTNRKGLKEILSGGGNNVLLANNTEEAAAILHQKEIGILLVNSDDSPEKASELLKLKNNQSKHIYKIVMTSDSVSGSKMVKGLNEGAVDFITIPFNPNLIQAKIEVFKSLFYKDQRINELLSNIFPATVLEDLNTNAKFSPKRIESSFLQILLISL